MKINLSKNSFNDAGILFRLFTENVNKKEVLDLANKYFSGYTAYEGIGCWEGKKENNLTIEIITDDADKINKLAKQIKLFNKQQAVYIQSVPFESYLI